jgi:hypothetical protein
MFIDLPEELLANVLSYMPVSDLINCELVSTSHDPSDV